MEPALTSMLSSPSLHNKQSMSVLWSLPALWLLPVINYSELTCRTPLTRPTIYYIQQSNSPTLENCNSFPKIEELLKSQIVSSTDLPGLDHSYFLVQSGVQLAVCSGAVLQSHLCCRHRLGLQGQSPPALPLTM